jgi:hypothetical protein
MTPLVWANFPLFLLAWAGNPLRTTLRHPDTAPGFAAATPSRRGGIRHRRAGNGCRCKTIPRQPASREDYCDQR